MAARAVQASKELLARLPSWRLLFQGRWLVVTNTLGGGVLMAVGDSLQQTREMHMEAGKVRDWRRTGERGGGQKTVTSVGVTTVSLSSDGSYSWTFNFLSKL